MSADQGSRGDDRLTEAFRQMMSEVTERMTQEIARVADERRREAVEGAAGAGQEGAQEAMEAILARLRMLEETVQGGFERLEERVDRLEQRPSSPEEEGAEPTKQLEKRMEALEASLDIALSHMMPKADALLQQMERRPPLESLVPSGTSSSTGAASASSPPSTASDAPPPRAPSPATRRRLGEELSSAVTDGWEGEVRSLLERGADTTHRDSFQRTPLLSAAFNGHAEIVALLLRAGADVGAEDRSGNTALHFSCLNDRRGRCASLLLGAGAPVNAKSENGRTPLHLAAIGGNEAAMRALLAAGAESAAEDNNGKTPLDVAKNIIVRRLLRR